MEENQEIHIKDQISQLTKQKKLTEAKDLANSWTQSESTNSLAWSTLAHVYISSKELDEAKSAISKSIALSPNEPAPQFTLGHIEFAKNDIDAANEAFKKCIEISEGLNWGYYLDSAKLSQAQCLVLKGEKEQAKSIASQIDSTTGIWLGGYITPAKILAD